MTVANRQQGKSIVGLVDDHPIVRQGLAQLINAQPDFSVGLEAWMGAVFACNAYIDAAAPWTLKKTDPERMAAVLGTLVAAVRPLAEAVAPVIPASAEKLIALIDSGSEGSPIAQPVPIFPRLELEEEAAARS